MNTLQEIPPDLLNVFKNNVSEWLQIVNEICELERKIKELKNELHLLESFDCNIDVDKNVVSQYLGNNFTMMKDITTGGNLHLDSIYKNKTNYSKLKQSDNDISGFLIGGIA